MKIGKLAIAAAMAGIALTSCQDDISDIGSSLMRGEVTIVVDSIEVPLKAQPEYYDSFDARTVSKLLGRINVPEYGALRCSFVTQMLSATRLNIPDSITIAEVDSMNLLLTVPRGALTGDSLAPQQLRAYKLLKQLPKDITSTFDPAGYYDYREPLGTSSYTLSNIANDSIYHKSDRIKIRMKMPMELCRDIFEKYRANDPIFEWPAQFNTYFPGLYVEQNFGNGCVANIAGVEMFTYWRRNERVYEKTGKDENGKDVYGYVNHVVRDSVCIMASQPEVLSSNIIRYDVSRKIKDMEEAGENVITSPGGYMINIEFPADRLLDEYESANKGLSVVSSLTMRIPAMEVKNDYGISVAPYLLMIRDSEREAFFRENKVPDGITSFYAEYNPDTRTYNFLGMRKYFLKLLEERRAGETIDAEDMRFTLMPVAITTETATNYQNSTVYVTKCTPYIAKPTMTRIHTERTQITFTFSSQEMEE